jgi:Cellulase (glycosyl hydrolase family 5)
LRLDLHDATKRASMRRMSIGRRFNAWVLCCCVSVACEGNESSSAGSSYGSTGGNVGSAAFGKGGQSQVGGSLPTGGTTAKGGATTATPPSTGGKGLTGGSRGGNGAGGSVNVEARLGGFSRGINLDRWFLAPIVANPASYITDDELSMLTTLGFDHARVLVHLEQLFIEDSPSVLNAKGIAELDAGLDLLLNHGLRVIVDLHNTDPEGGGERYSYRLEEEAGFVDQFIEFWRTFAEHLSLRDPERVLNR